MLGSHLTGSFNHVVYKQPYTSKYWRTSSKIRKILLDMNVSF